MKENSYELVRRIYRKQTINKYEKKATYLGYKSLNGVYSFLLIRLVICFFIFCYIFVFSKWNLLLAPLVTIFIYYMFSYIVFDYRLKEREKKLEKEAMYFFEVFALSIDSGKNIIKALEATTSNLDLELSNEFASAIKEIEYGKSFHDAFQDLRNRIPSDIIQNVILNIMEVYSSGGNITKTLNQQIAFIRNKRVMSIKESINKIPIKVSVVSVFIFIPLILLLLLSPVILEYLLSI